MAIDTRDKRSSAINVGSPWRSMLPAPDGAVSQLDRQHVALYYTGISAFTPLVEVQIAATLTGTSSISAGLSGTSAVSATLTGTRTVSATLTEQ